MVIVDELASGGGDVDGGADSEGVGERGGRLGDSLESVVRVKAFSYFLSTGSMIPFSAISAKFADSEYLGGIIGM